MAPTRRSLLRSLGGVVPLALAGCAAVEEDDPGSEAAHAPTSTAAPRGDTAVSPAEQSATDRAARAALPEASDGWKLVGIDRISATNLGGKAGFTGEYRNPAGTRFRVVALEMTEEYDGADKADRWACIGWDVAVAYEGFAFAAGTGTEQATYTPETPPHMDRTAVPGSAEQSRALLARSPMLDSDAVAANAVTCEG